MKFFIRNDSPWQTFIHVGIALCIVAILVISFFFIYLPWSTNHGEVVAVPNLVGVSLEDLEEKLDARGLELVVEDSSYSKSYRPYTVLSQYPEPNEKVKVGRKIYLTVSPKDPPIVKMPNLTGITYTMAMMRLRSYNLELGNIKFKPDMALDVVLSQEVNGKTIQSGQAIRMGTHVDLLVGNGVGDEEFDVPDLEGLTLEEAEDVLKGYDLDLGVVNTDYESEEPFGTIVRQNPAVYIELDDDEEFDEDGRVVKKKKKEDDDDKKKSNSKKKKKKRRDKKAPKNKIRAGELIDVWVSGNEEELAVEEVVEETDTAPNVDDE
ncbi:MAG: PASTA domain-containing protein [Thermonemataceae bacterium]